MSKFKTKQELIDEIVKERKLFEDLLDSIPGPQKTEVVTDGMSVKDFLAHRTEWGRMMIGWYTEAKAGEQPTVPSEKYKWNQLKALNADIFARYKDVSLETAESEFKKVHDQLLELIKSTSEQELFEKRYFGFTGSSDLVSYFNSATAAHYRSARKLINRWWKGRQVS